MICIGCSNIKNEKRTEREMLESLEALEEPLQVFYDGTGYFLLKSFVDSHPEINIRLVNCLPDTDNGFDEFDLNKTIEEYGEPDLIIARDELSVYLSEMFHEGHIADLTDFCSPKFKKSKFFLTVCVSVGFDFLFDDFLSTAFHVSYFFT